MFSRVLIELDDDPVVGESWNRSVRELVYVLLFGGRAKDLLDRTR